MKSQAFKESVRGVIMANLSGKGHAAGPGPKNSVALISRPSDDDHNAPNSRVSSPPLIYSGQQDDDHNRAASAKSSPVPLLSSRADTDHTVGQGPSLRSLSSQSDQDHTVGQGPSLPSLSKASDNDHSKRAVRKVGAGNWGR